MKPVMLAITRRPARAERTYTLQSSAYRTNRCPRASSSRTFSTRMNRLIPVHFLRTMPIWIPLGVWLLVYPTRVIVSHDHFGTNAYDLSVFEYAIWSTLHGELGRVPFMGQSLFSHHFMPTLLVLVPLYALWSSPLFLIAVQLLVLAAAAVLLWRLGSGKVPPLLLAAILVAFLFGRRSHSAVTSVFYIESLEPLLVFGVLMAYEHKYWAWYWCLVILALGCKEDMALYFIPYGLVITLTGERWRGLTTCVVAAVWLLFAVAVAIPAARASDHLPGWNPFVADTLRTNTEASTASIGSELTNRIVSLRAVEKLGLLLASTAFLPLAAPLWALIPLPGALVNLAAHSGTVQSGLTGHYLWPILPWLFWATLLGAQRVSQRHARLAKILAVLFLVVIVADSPLWLGVRRDLSGLFTDLNARSIDAVRR